MISGPCIGLVSRWVSPHHLPSHACPSLNLNGGLPLSATARCHDSCDESITLTSISFPTGRFKLQYSRWCRGFLRCNQSVWEFWKHDSHLFHQSLLLWEASSRKSRGKLASGHRKLHSRPDARPSFKPLLGQRILLIFFFLVSPPSHPPFPHFFPCYF